MKKAPRDPLTPRMIELINELFILMDKNNDGILDESEGLLVSSRSDDIFE